MTMSRIAGVLLGVTTLCLPGAAWSQAQTYVDLQGGLGYSTNPLLVGGSNTGSAFARLSAYGFHGWTTERSQSSVSAYIENSTYFRRYSNTQIFSLNAQTSRSVSERVTVYGNLGFSGDFGGQLGSRFFSVPTAPVVANPAGPTAPAVPVPSAPGSFVPGDPDLFGLTSRQYRLSGQLGASVALSARDSMTVSAGAQHVFTGGDGRDLDYSQYDTSLGYERQINERLAWGGRLIAQYSDYTGGRSVTSIGPQATLRARLSEQWDVTAAAGFVHTREDRGPGEGNDSSIDLAVDGSVCRNLESERICGRVARRSQSTILGGSSTSTSAAFDYYRRLNARDTIQATASVSSANGLRTLDIDQRSTFYSLAGSYNRMLNDRLSAGANAAVRRLSRAGPDPRTDVGGSLYVRYRLGNVR